MRIFLRTLCLPTKEDYFITSSVAVMILCEARMGECESADSILVG